MMLIMREIVGAIQPPPANAEERVTAHPASPPVCAAPSPDPGRPLLAAPPGTCDAHMHLFPVGDRYPLTPARSYSPPPAPLEHYRRVMAALGIARAVLVQASIHGTDNRMLLDVLRDEPETFRGIAVVDSTVGDAELEALNAAGVRGVRINLLYGGGVGFSEAEALKARIRALGWHFQFLIDVARVERLGARLAALGVPAVIDHMGHMSGGADLANPGFQDVLALLREGRAWVKLSGPYRFSAEPLPPYGDTIALSRALIEAAPSQLVWATDWPHPALSKPMPQDAALLDLLSEWTTDAALRRRILVDNPARLYGFPSPP
jgi:predicted TIM-barrel fold metal-dependent hydrolase